MCNEAGMCISRSFMTMPGSVVAYLGFVDEVKAADFEIYLISGSGRAFAAKRFW